MRRCHCARACVSNSKSGRRARRAGIPIGKLDLYVAAGGFNPARVLPIVLDVGTNNAKLREHPLYMGLNQPRLDGVEYFSFLDEFVTAVTQRYPKAVLQFEDFSIDRALPLLDRYRGDHLVFNDDIQARAAAPRACAWHACCDLASACQVRGLQHLTHRCRCTSCNGVDA
jgi:malic enzyme